MSIQDVPNHNIECKKAHCFRCGECVDRHRRLCDECRKVAFDAPYNPNFPPPNFWPSPNTTQPRPPDYPPFRVVC